MPHPASERSYTAPHFTKSSVLLHKQRNYRTNPQLSDAMNVRDSETVGIGPASEDVGSRRMWASRAHLGIVRATLQCSTMMIKLNAFV